MQVSADLLTVDELAILLRLNRDTTYRAIAQRQIPGVRRVGRNIRICKDTVVQWLSAGDRICKEKPL